MQFKRTWNLEGLPDKIKVYIGSIKILRLLKTAPIFQEFILSILCITIKNCLKNK